jgi:hypothetical protein
MSQLEIFQVIVSEHVEVGMEPKFKIVWNYRNHPALPYYIPISILKDRATEVRVAMQQLIDKGMMADGYLGSCGAELRELAVAGHKLYKALFRTGYGYDASIIQDWLRKEKETLDAQGKRAQISFVVDSLAHIPWGLIYDGPVESLSGDPVQDAIEYYEDFWCLKFLLTSVYRRVHPEWLAGSGSSGPNEFLSVLDRSAFDKAAKYLAQPQEKILEWIESRFGRGVEASEDFFRVWQSKGERYRLLYFYCHANRTSLALGPDDLISMSDFRDGTVIPRSTQQSTCVVFLNGCNTAVGDPEGAFLVATGDFLFCGFIGTETKVPDVFALRFGLAFLYCFLHEGWPIFQVMDYLRRQHWPIALTYSTYCQPLLSFAAAQRSFEVEFTENFSRQLLGRTQM